MRYLQFFVVYIWNFLFCAIRKIVGRGRIRRYFYYGKRIKGKFESNEFIYNSLQSGKPFLAARFGDVELRALLCAKEIELGLRNTYPEYVRKTMHLNAGFFPTDDNGLNEFGKILWESSKSVDIFGVWYNLMEDYFIYNTNKDAELTVLEYLEPYRSDNPWSKALKNKKVLVIHPFEESIRIQYSRRQLLFDNQDVLPEFTLLTYKAIQTNADSISVYNTWFDALDKMYVDISAMDFDVAIVACGAYGLPLAAKIKDLGKQAIHLGGATQILFGIKGARWEAKPEVAKLFNEYWIRPSEAERPKNADKVEGACYW